MKASEMQDYVLNHRHGGNGWIAVHDMGDNFVRGAELPACAKLCYMIADAMLAQRKATP